MNTTDLFWPFAVVAVLLIIGAWRAAWASVGRRTPRNDYLTTRERLNSPAHLSQRYPSTPGPHGFDRRAHTHQLRKKAQ